MTKTHSPYLQALMGSGSKKALKLSLFIMMLCFGQTTFAATWGSGVELWYPPSGTHYGGFTGGKGTINNSQTVDSNAGNIGQAKIRDYGEGSTCGRSNSFNTSGGCTGSASAGGGCAGSTPTSAADVIITSNATTACTINYSANSDAGSASANVVIKIKQYVGWVTYPSFKIVTDADYLVTAQGQNIQGGGPSGVTPSYTSNTPSICTVSASGSSGLVHNVAGGGLCRITATITTGNANWAPPVTTTAYQEWFVYKAQTITVTTAAPAGPKIVGTTFPVAATASPSGNAVAITTSGGCAVQSGGSGSATIVITDGVTACTVNYNQAGDSIYGAAPTVSSSTSVSKAAQTITVTSIPATAPIGVTFNIVAQVLNNTTGLSSGLPIAFTVASGLCTILSTSNTTAVVQADAVTSCTFNLNQAGNTAYTAAAQVVSAAVNVAKSSQTITFPAPASAVTYVSGGSFPLVSAVTTPAGPFFRATSTSGYAISYTVASGPCTLTGAGFDVLSPSAAGTCVINANQAGNASYNAAAQVQRSFVFNPSAQTITVTSAAPATAQKSTTFNVAASSSSGLAVAITASGTCTAPGGATNSATITVGASLGACTVYYNQTGSVSYNAATQVSSVTDVILKPQAISVIKLPPNNVPRDPEVGSAFQVQANSDSGLVVGIAITGSCAFTIAPAVAGSVTSATIQYSATGIIPCVITYTQAGDSNYSAATSVQNTVNVIRTAQSITVSPAPPANLAVGGTYGPITATASSTLGVTIVSSGGCTGTTTVTMNSATTNCTITFTQAGNDTYTSAQVIYVIKESTKPSLLTVTAVPSPTNKTPEFTFSSSETGTIVYGGSCSSGTTFANVGNNTITFKELAAGTYTNCTVTVVDASGNASLPLALGSFTVVPSVVAYVKPTATGTGDCTSWANACANIQTAINAPGVNEVWIAKGIYKPASTIILKSGVGVYGGFLGSESSYVPSYISTSVNLVDGAVTTSIYYGPRSAADNLTIISGDKDNNDTVDSRGLVLHAADVKGTNLSRLFSATDQAKKIKMSGLILNAAGRDISGAGGASAGAAILITDSSVEVDTTQFVFNKGSDGGAVAVTSDAGAVNTGGKFLAIDSVFLNNESTGLGGAIASKTGPTVINTVTIQNSTFESNIAGTNGGAIHNGMGQLSVLNSTFYGNSLVTTTGLGGAIDLASLAYSSAMPGSAAIKYSTFVENIAGTAAAPNGRGGAINVNTAATAVVNLLGNLILNNKAAATWGTNISDMDRITDGGYNVVGYNGVSGMVKAVSTTYDFVGGTSATAPTVLLSDIIAVDAVTGKALLANNGGYGVTVKLNKTSYARDRVPNIHADCESATAVGLDQRGYGRPEVSGHDCDVGAVEWEETNPCNDPNRQKGFFIMTYPDAGATCVGAGGTNIKLGAIQPLYLLFLAFIGIVLQVKRQKKQWV